MLDRIAHQIRVSGEEIYSFQVWQKGQKLVEEYYHGHGPKDLQKLYSCTKSISSLLIGLAIQHKGLDYETVLNQKVVDLFHDFKIENPSARKSAMTVEHLLNQTAGFKWKETGRPWGPEHSGWEMEHSDHWVEFVLAREVASEPGKRYAYNTGVSHLLTVLVEIITGIPADQFAQEYLWKPLGIQEVEWTRDKQGYVQGGKGLSMCPEDLAKVGMMVLQNGMYQGLEVIDSEWLELSLSPQSKGHQYYGTYGYQWWLKNLAEGPEPAEDGYNVRCGIGYGGQFLYLVPEWNLLAVFTGNMVGAEKFEVPQTIFKDEVLPLFQP